MVLIKASLIAILFSASVVQATALSIDDLSVLEKPLPEKKIAFKTMGDSKNKFYLLSAIARDYASQPLTAAAAKEGKSYADTLLEMAKVYEKDWNYGNAIHHGNLILGRVALFKGDIKTAKRYLILATKISGSPQLHSFGPNMTLAKELLAKKEKDVVLSYLDACLLFWTNHRAKEQVKSWKHSISKGETPDFGGNLEY